MYVYVILLTLDDVNTTNLDDSHVSFYNRKKSDFKRTFNVL